MLPRTATAVRGVLCAQVESTMKMQSLQPQVKALQDSYKGKPQDEMQARLARNRCQAARGASTGSPPGGQSCTACLGQSWVLPGS